MNTASIVHFASILQVRRLIEMFAVPKAVTLQDGSTGLSWEAPRWAYVMLNTAEMGDFNGSTRPTKAAVRP